MTQNELWLKLKARGPSTSRRLSEELDIPQAQISKQLGQLYDKGRVRKEYDTTSWGIKYVYTTI